MGRRQLLTMSVMGALVSLFAVGYGLNAGFVTLSSIAILAFVTYVSHLCMGGVLMARLSCKDHSLLALDLSLL